jgi:hypothetical protein
MAATFRDGAALVRATHWVLGLATIAVCGVATVWLLTPGESARLRRENEELVRQKEQLDREKKELARAIERLTAATRLADILVLDQTPRGAGGPVMTTLQFVEWDRQGKPLPARIFVIQDDVIFFDALVIKFNAEHVAAGDALRGKSVSLFRRVYGEHQNPAEGYCIDPEGDVPSVFRVNPEPSPFERRLWSQFWDYVGNPQLAAAEGVRVAQGEAVYVRMRKGQQWTLNLDNNGGMNINLCGQLTEAQMGSPTPGDH